jgi:hypothetical protein
MRPHLDGAAVRMPGGSVCAAPRVLKGIALGARNRGVLFRYSEEMHDY